MQTLPQNITSTVLTLKAANSAILQTNALLRLKPKSTLTKKTHISNQSFARKMPYGPAFPKPFGFRDSNEDGFSGYTVSSSPPAFSNPFSVEAACSPWSFESKKEASSHTSSNGFMDMSDLPAQLPVTRKLQPIFDEPMKMETSDDSKQATRKPNRAQIVAVPDNKTQEVVMDTLDEFDDFEDGLSEDNFEDAALKVARVLVAAHEQGMDTDSLNTQLTINMLR
jgi:hypothetical protein